MTGLIVKEKIIKEGRALIIGNWRLLHYHHIISGRALVQSRNDDIDRCFGEPSHGNMEDFTPWPSQVENVERMFSTNLNLERTGKDAKGQSEVIDSMC